MTLTVDERAKVLVEALPYIKRFHGQIVVIKVGGNALEQARDETLLDIVLLRYVGMQPVLIHGGGPEITAMSERLGLKAQFKNGLRITDDKTMEVVKMVLTGKVNPDIVGAINRLGGQAVGLSGEDGPCIIAEPLGPDMGFVGRVTQINREPVTALLGRGYIPVIASSGQDDPAHRCRRCARSRRPRGRGAFDRGREASHRRRRGDRRDDPEARVVPARVGGGAARAHRRWAHAALAAAGALHRGRHWHDGDAVMALTSWVVGMPVRRYSAARTKIPQIGWVGGSGWVNKDASLIKAVGLV